MPEQLRTPLLRQLVVLTTYALAAWACLELPVRDGPVTPVWVPAGLALAFMLRWGPWIALGVFTADIATNVLLNDYGATPSIGLGVAAVLDPLAAVTVLTGIGFRDDLRRVSDIVALLVTCAGSATISATLGTAALWVNDFIPSGDVGQAWFTYWSSGAVGYVLVTPFVLVWLPTHARLRMPRPARLAEAAACGALVILVSSGAFLGDEWRLLYVLLLFPAFIWASLRFGARGATAAILASATIAIWGTVRETVYLVDLNGTQTAQALQSILAAVIVANLVMSLALSERARAVTEAEHTADTLARAQHLAHMGSWEIDVDTGELSWCSPELERMLWPDGPPRPVTIDALNARVADRDRARVRSTLRDAIARHAGFQVELGIAEDERHVLLAGTMLDDADDSDDSEEHDHMVVSVLDVTERRHMQELQDELVATASHDLRTPLTAISGFAETLVVHWSDLSVGDRLGMIHIIRSQGVRMKELVDNALMQSRLDAGKIRSARNVVHVLDVVADAVREQHAEGVVVECDPRLTVRGDREQLAGVVARLISNARRHGRPPVVVTAAPDASARVVVLRVADHGAGVPTALVPHLFTRQVRDGEGAVPGGSGLGLSIAQSIVERAGGTVRYERDAHDRTVFVVELPAAEPDD